MSQTSTAALISSSPKVEAFKGTFIIDINGYLSGRNLSRIYAFQAGLKGFDTLRAAYQSDESTPAL